MKQMHGEENNTAGFRFFKVLITLSYISVFVTASTSPFWVDRYSVQEWSLIFLSAIPLLFLLVVQYIIYSTLSATYVYRDKKMLYFAIFLIFAYSPIGIYIAAVSSISPSRAIVSAIKAVAIGGVIFYVTYKGDKKVSLKEIKQKRAEILFKELKSGETMTKDDFDILDGMTPKDAMRALKLNEKNLKKLAKA